jgi:hypothetical protein
MIRSLPGAPAFGFEFSGSIKGDVKKKHERVGHLTKNMDESISGANRAQKGQASIASERNEMQMAASIVANEFVGHGTEEKSKPRPFKLERVGHPEKPNQSLGVDVLEWYPLNVIRRQEGNWGRVGHPRVKQVSHSKGTCSFSAVR